MAHGRESKAIALRAARASIEANITALEMAADLVAQGLAAPRQRLTARAIDSSTMSVQPAGQLATVRAIG